MVVGLVWPISNPTSGRFYVGKPKPNSLASTLEPRDDRNINEFEFLRIPDLNNRNIRHSVALMFGEISVYI